MCWRPCGILVWQPDSSPGPQGRQERLTAAWGGRGVLLLGSGTRKLFLIRLHSYFWTPPPTMGCTAAPPSVAWLETDHTHSSCRLCFPDWPRSLEHRLSDNSVWNLILTQNVYVSAIWADRLYEYVLSCLSSIRPCFIGWAWQGLC